MATAAVAAPPAAFDATAPSAPLSPGAQQRASVLRQSAAAPAAAASGEDPALKPAGTPATLTQSLLPGTNPGTNAAASPPDTGSDGFRPLMRDGSCKVQLACLPPLFAASKGPQAAVVLSATSTMHMPGIAAGDSTVLLWYAGRRHTLFGRHPAVIGA